MKTFKTKHLVLSCLLIGGVFVAGGLSMKYSNKVQSNPVHSGSSATTKVNKQETSGTSETPASTSKNLKNAPKQAAIKSRVTVEHIYRALATANDPGYVSSWPLQKVNASAAWNTTTGNDQTLVAVIDTGFGLAHEDLSGSWKTNDGEVGSTQLGDNCWTGVTQSKQTNNCDDDGNGYVDDWRGWNFSAGTNNPQAGQVSNSSGSVTHGTEVAGLVGARGNNALGIATIDWNTKILPLQALDDTGIGYTSDIAAAIYYAVDSGADVINMSLGGSDFDQDLSDAISYAYNHDVVVVAAAGNCGTGNELGCSPSAPGALSYPALDDHVIAVGATNQSDQRASFSSYGQGLDVVAPGAGTITSTAWSPSNQTSAYATSLNGTSFSSPQVASLVALIKSIRPTTSVDDVTALVLGTSTKLSAMSGQFFTAQYGHGLINAASAITVASSLNATPAANPNLAQAGGYKGEQLYSAGETLGSGCQASATAYCTVWLKSTRLGYDRYLPYTLSNSSGIVGWNWSSNALGADSWTVRAVQGESISTSTYQLMAK